MVATSCTSSPPPTRLRVELLVDELPPVMALLSAAYACARAGGPLRVTYYDREEVLEVLLAEGLVKRLQRSTLVASSSTH